MIYMTRESYYKSEEKTSLKEAQMVMEELRSASSQIDGLFTNPDNNILNWGYGTVLVYDAQRNGYTALALMTEQEYAEDICKNHFIPQKASCWTSHLDSDISESQFEMFAKLIFEHGELSFVDEDFVNEYYENH